MTLMARNSPGIFEQVEAWILEGHGKPELRNYLKT